MTKAKSSCAFPYDIDQVSPPVMGFCAVAIITQNWIWDKRCHACGAIVLLLSGGEALLLKDGQLISSWATWTKF